MGVVIVPLTFESFPVRLDLNSVMEANMKGMRRSRTDLRACMVNLRKARITPTITVRRMKSSPPTHTTRVHVTMVTPIHVTMVTPAPPHPA